MVARAFSSNSGIPSYAFRSAFALTFTETAIGTCSSRRSQASLLHHVMAYLWPEDGHPRCLVLASVRRLFPTHIATAFQEKLNLVISSFPQLVPA